MAEHIISDPDEAGKKKVSGGTLYVGKEYDGKQVEFAMRVIEDNE